MNSLDELKKIMETQEDLHPALRLYQYEDDTLGTCIKHPLVFSIMHAPFMNAMANKQFEQKLAARRRAAEEKNWHTYVFLHERPYRFGALIEIMFEIEDDCAYWDLIGDVWTDSENIYENYADWEDVLSSERPCRESMMNEEEQKFLASLPDELTIYRGLRFMEDQYDGIEGFSWTLDQKRAEWFALRFAGAHGDTSEVATARVKKSDVIAYLAGRGEEEIIILPGHVTVIDRKEIS